MTPRIAGVLAAILVACGSAHAGAPLDLIKKVYDDMDASTDAAHRAWFTDPAKAKLDQSDAVSASGSIGCLDGTLPADAQDFDEAAIRSTLKFTEKISADTATVTAKFRLFKNQPKERREIVWSLREVDGTWKIADYFSRSGNWKLSEMDCSQ